jgi:hypothetical protein
MIQVLCSLKIVGRCWQSGSGQNEVTWTIRSFDHLQNENSKNFENQRHRQLPKLSEKWLYSTFWLRTTDLWLPGVDSNFWDVFRLGWFNKQLRVVLLVIIFLGVNDSQIPFLYAIWVYDAMTRCRFYTFLTKRKVCQYRWRTYSQWQKRVQQSYSSELTWVSVLQKMDHSSHQPSLMSTKDQYWSTTLMPIATINKKIRHK